VITLYLDVGHAATKYEEDFLMSVANTVACLVEIKKIHRKLEDKAGEIENRNRELDEINTALGGFCLTKEMKIVLKYRRRILDKQQRTRPALFRKLEADQVKYASEGLYRRCRIKFEEYSFFISA